jgi:hypothetical protein
MRLMLAAQYQDLTDRTAAATESAHAGILSGEGVLVQPTEGPGKVAYDLLRADDPYHPVGRVGVRPQLTAGTGRHDHLSGLRDRVDAADHDLRRRPKAALLGATSLPAQFLQLRAETTVPITRRTGPDQPELLQRLRVRLQDLVGGGEPGQDLLASGGPVGHDGDVEPIPSEGGGHPVDPRARRNAFVREGTRRTGRSAGPSAGTSRAGPQSGPVMRVRP